jgi:cytochrome c556
MRREATRRIAAIAVAACAIAFPANSHEGEGHGHATGVVKERMVLMEELGKRMKAINTRIKDKQKLTAINDNARAIATSAGHIAHLFPPGSTQSPTEARAAIWQNFADFEQKAKALETESAKLAETNVADFVALSAQARAVSQACAVCHEAYRLNDRRVSAPARSTCIVPIYVLYSYHPAR